MSVSYGNVDMGRDVVGAVGPIYASCGHVGRPVTTPERVLVGDVSTDVEMVSYRAFKRGSMKG